MMENNFQSSSSDRSTNSVPQFIQAQPFPWTEVQGDSWNFQELLSIIRRRSLVIVGVSITMMAGVLVNLTLTQKQPEYEGSFQLLVEPVNDDTKIDIVKDSANATQAGLDYESQIQVLKSPELMGSIVKQLQVNYPDITYDSLLKSLTVARLENTKIIEVSYRSNNPNQTQFVLNHISEDYLDYSREKRQTKLRQGIKFIDKELPSTQNRVDQLQQELQIFRQKYEFTDPEKQVAQINTQIASSWNQRQSIDQQLAQARANFTVLKENNGKLALLNNASLYQQLISQLRQVDVQIATESTRLQDDNPTIQALKDKRASLLPLLQQEAQRIQSVKTAEVTTQIQTLEAQSQELAKTEQKLEQQRKQWPILSRQYTELQRKLDVATESLNRFLSTRENLKIQVSQTELGWQLIKRPTKPETPISNSSIQRYLIPGLIASLAIGIGVALLMEKLDKTYRSVNILKEKVKLPLLGNIPYEKQIQIPQDHTHLSKIPVVKLPNSFVESIPGLAVVPDKDYSNYSSKFLEALRVLCTNIQLLSSDRPISSIIISSATPGDGKSTIAFHLAQVATAMGQRVLLVDADLRQPKIHTLSELNNLWGLSNLISTNLPMGEVIRQLPAMSQLSVITAGPIPPDPTKLLSSEKMKRLMKDFQNTFDLVIYDAPPMLGLADASLLAPNTDGILLVVRMDKTNSSLLDRAIDKLKTSRMNVLGIIANGQKNDINGY